MKWILLLFGLIFFSGYSQTWTKTTIGNQVQVKYKYLPTETGNGIGFSDAIYYPKGKVPDEETIYLEMQRRLENWKAVIVAPQTYIDKDSVFQGKDTLVKFRVSYYEPEKSNVVLFKDSVIYPYKVVPKTEVVNDLMNQKIDNFKAGVKPIGEIIKPK